MKNNPRRIPDLAEKGNTLSGLFVRLEFTAGIRYILEEYAPCLLLPAFFRPVGPFPVLFDPVEAGAEGIPAP
jgi:hypothetical protein